SAALRRRGVLPGARARRRRGAGFLLHCGIAARPRLLIPARANRSAFLTTPAPDSGPPRGWFHFRRTGAPTRLSALREAGGDVFRSRSRPNQGRFLASDELTAHG